MRTLTLRDVLFQHISGVDYGLDEVFELDPVWYFVTVLPKLLRDVAVKRFACVAGGDAVEKLVEVRLCEFFLFSESSLRKLV